MPTIWLPIWLQIQQLHFKNVEILEKIKTCWNGIMPTIYQKIIEDNNKLIKKLEYELKYENSYDRYVDSQFDNE